MPAQTMTESDPAAIPATAHRYSGRVIVIGMIVLGLLSAAGIYTYWSLQMAPFVTVRKALQAEYPHGLVRVEGGKPKRGPSTLRVIIEVPTTPVEGDPLVHTIVARIVELARQHLDVGRYERLQVFLVHPLTPGQAERLKLEYPFQELLRNPRTAPAVETNASPATGRAP